VFVLHGAWLPNDEPRLALWAEDSSAPAPPRRPGRAPRVRPHPCAAPHGVLLDLVSAPAVATMGTTTLTLPARGARPLDSPQLVREEIPAASGPVQETHYRHIIMSRFLYGFAPRFWYSCVMSISPLTPVLPSGDARTALPEALRRFRAEGSSAEPIVFGAHRKAEAVVIPFELYAQLLPVIEDLEIAQLVRERAAAGESVPLAAVAAAVGLDPASYR
jgi:antitoxin StbD